MVKVYIQAEGNSTIGLGHIYRCIALGQMLSDFFEVHFLSIEIPEALKDNLVQLGFRFSQISTNDDLFQLVEKDDFVVLDNYCFDFEYYRKLRNQCRALIVIDDLQSRLFDADLIINHAPNIIATGYQAAPYTQFALGLEYVLLRPEFLRLSYKDIHEIDSLIICFGGADPRNLTYRCLKLAAKECKFRKIIVVTGDAYLFQNSLSEFASISSIEFHRNVGEAEMAKLFSVTDAAMVPSSGILLEAIKAGCKVISGKYVENQNILYSSLKSTRAFIDGGNFAPNEITSALEQLLSTRLLSALPLIDGKSGQRILNLFQQLECEKYLSLRKATEADVDLTFRWANDKHIREFSFSKKDIKENEHHKWFHSKITDPNCIYLVAYYKDSIIGSIRFDINERIATISYHIDSEFVNRGFGKMMLKIGIKHLIEHAASSVDEVIGFVKVENIPSVKCFERLGFEQILEAGTYIFKKKIDENWKA
jgi:UDP-2,4-diacetamido-2,4,6-trideoxy-beta-L-altropyranose hydrolase